MASDTTIVVCKQLQCLILQIHIGDVGFAHQRRETCLLLFLIRSLQLTSNKNASLPLAPLCFDVKVQNYVVKVRIVRKVQLVGFMCLQLQLFL